MWSLWILIFLLSYSYLTFHSKEFSQLYYLSHNKLWGRLSWNIVTGPRSVLWIHITLIITSISILRQVLIHTESSRQKENWSPRQSCFPFLLVARCSGTKFQCLLQNKIPTLLIFQMALKMWIFTQAFDKADQSFSSFVPIWVCYFSHLCSFASFCSVFNFFLKKCKLSRIVKSWTA